MSSTEKKSALAPTLLLLLLISRRCQQAQLANAKLIHVSQWGPLIPGISVMALVRIGFCPKWPLPASGGPCTRPISSVPAFE